MSSLWRHLQPTQSWYSFPHFVLQLSIHSFVYSLIHAFKKCISKNTMINKRRSFFFHKMYILVVRRYTIEQVNEHLNKIISNRISAIKERKEVGVIENWFALDRVAERLVEETAHVLRHTREETSHATTWGRVSSRGSSKYRFEVWSSLACWRKGEKQAGGNVLSKGELGTRYIWRWFANLFTLNYELLENRARILLEFASLVLSLIYDMWSTSMWWMTELIESFPKVIYKTLGIFCITLYNLPSLNHLFQHGWSCSIFYGPWKRYLLRRASFWWLNWD